MHSSRILNALEHEYWNALKHSSCNTYCHRRPNIELFYRTFLWCHCCPDRGFWFSLCFHLGCFFNSPCPRHFVQGLFSSWIASLHEYQWIIGWVFILKEQALIRHCNRETNEPYMFWQDKRYWRMKIQRWSDESSNKVTTVRWMVDNSEASLIHQ